MDRRLAGLSREERLRPRALALWWQRPRPGDLGGNICLLPALLLLGLMRTVVGMLRPDIRIVVPGEQK